MESSEDSRSNDSSEHFFVPFGTGFSRHGQDKKLNSLKSRQLIPSQADFSLHQTHAMDNNLGRKYSEVGNLLNELGSLDEFDGVNNFLHSPVSDVQRSFYDMDEAQDQVFSPPLLMDTALLGDSYEDLLGMIILA